MNIIEVIIFNHVIEWDAILLYFSCSKLYDPITTLYPIRTVPLCHSVIEK